MGRATSDLRALLYIRPRLSCSPRIRPMRSLISFLCDRQTQTSVHSILPRLINSRSVQKKTVREGGAAA